MPVVRGTGCFAHIGFGALYRLPLWIFPIICSHISPSWHGKNCLCKFYSDSLINLSSSSAYAELSGNYSDKRKSLCDLMGEAYKTIKTMGDAQPHYQKSHNEGDFRA